MWVGYLSAYSACSAQQITNSSCLELAMAEISAERLLEASQSQQQPQCSPGLNCYLELPDAKDKVLSQENIYFY